MPLTALSSSTPAPSATTAPAPTSTSRLPYPPTSRTSSATPSMRWAFSATDSSIRPPAVSTTSIQPWPSLAPCRVECSVLRVLVSTIPPPGMRRSLRADSMPLPFSASFLPCTLVSLPLLPICGLWLLSSLAKVLRWAGQNEDGLGEYVSVGGQVTA